MQVPFVELPLQLCSVEPTGVTWAQILGVSALAGVGFTMAIFIGELAFSEALLGLGKPFQKEEHVTGLVATIDPIQEFKLKNGLRLLVGRSTLIPAVSMQMYHNGGLLARLYEDAVSRESSERFGQWRPTHAQRFRQYACFHGGPPSPSGRHGDHRPLD